MAHRTGPNDDTSCNLFGPKAQRAGAQLHPSQPFPTSPSPAAALPSSRSGPATTRWGGKCVKTILCKCFSCSCFKCVFACPIYHSKWQWPQQEQPEKQQQKKEREQQIRSRRWRQRISAGFGCCRRLLIVPVHLEFYLKWIMPATTTSRVALIPSKKNKKKENERKAKTKKKSVNGKTRQNMLYEIWWET